MTGRAAVILSLAAFGCLGLHSTSALASPATFCGPLAQQPSNAPSTCPSGQTFVAASPSGLFGIGPWVTASGSTPFQNAQGLSGVTPRAPIVGVALAPIGTAGYWMAGADGGVFTIGDPAFSSCPCATMLAFHGSLGGQRLNAPVVGISGTRDGNGYWLVTADGGVFAFGDAGFYGSMASHHLNAPIVGMAPMYDDHGYWLVSADGGVFAFGDAIFYGSMAGQPLNAPVVGILAFGDGYYLAGQDGGIFNFGFSFPGSAVGLTDAPVFAIYEAPIVPDADLSIFVAERDGTVVTPDAIYQR